MLLVVVMLLAVIFWILWCLWCLGMGFVLFLLGPLRRVDKLTDAIKTRNLLQFYPIIVDRDLVVYDGQRRLEAAGRASVPIYYIVLQNVSMGMILCVKGR